MPVFVNSSTGDVLNVSTEGMSSVHALLALGWTQQGETPEIPKTPEPAQPSTTTHERPNNGASRADWATYAQTLGIDPTGMKRAEIMAAVNAL